MNARKTGKEKMSEAIKIYRKKIRKFFLSHSSSPSDVQLMRDAYGKGRLTDSVLSSDLELRRRSQRYLSESLEALRLENPNLNFTFWSFIHSRANTSDREPVVDLKFFRSAIDKTFRKLGLDAIYVIEFQGLGNRPGKGQGRTILMNGHAIVFSEQKLKIEAIARELNGSDAWQSILSAEAVDIKSIVDKPGELDYLAYYLFKPPHEVKMAELRKRGERLKSVIEGYRPEFAARHFELLTQMELFVLVWGVGEGKHIRQDWARRLRYWHRSRRNWGPGKMPAFYFDDLWDRFRNRKKRAGYQPFKILR